MGRRRVSLLPLLAGLCCCGLRLEPPDTLPLLEQFVLCDAQHELLQVCDVPLPFHGQFLQLVHETRGALVPFALRRTSGVRNDAVGPDGTWALPAGGAHSASRVRVGCEVRVGCCRRVLIGRIGWVYVFGAAPVPLRAAPVPLLRALLRDTDHDPVAWGAAFDAAVFAAPTTPGAAPTTPGAARAAAAMARQPGLTEIVR